MEEEMIEEPIMITLSDTEYIIRKNHLFSKDGRKIGYLKNNIPVFTDTSEIDTSEQSGYNVSVQQLIRQYLFLHSLINYEFSNIRKGAIIRVQKYRQDSDDVFTFGLVLDRDLTDCKYIDIQTFTTIQEIELSRLNIERATPGFLNS